MNNLNIPSCFGDTSKIFQNKLLVCKTTNENLHGTTVALKWSLSNRQFLQLKKKHLKYDAKNTKNIYRNKLHSNFL